MKRRIRLDYRRIQVAPVAGALGAEIGGVDLSQPLDDQVFDEVLRAFLDHQVIFFREQTLTPESQKAFASRFGPLHVHPYAKSLPGHPEVMPVIREPEDLGRNFGGSWHADLVFEEEPVLGSALYAIDVPKWGGDTMFASQYLAFETLSEGLREQLLRLRAVHTPARAYGSRTIAAARAMGIKAADEAREVVHPVVRTHPQTGRKCLFVNRLSTHRFEGWTEAESRPLLELLWTHAAKPELTCRFRWARGSLAFWDNRCVQHFALNDYAGRRREMNRITICGDRPY